MKPRSKRLKSGADNRPSEPFEIDDCGGGFYDTNQGEVIEDIDEQETWDVLDDDL